MSMFILTQQGFFAARGAVVVGDVSIGAKSSVWFNAVIRGDVAPVRLGARVNVQDNAVIHCDSGVANEIGDDVTIGHGAVVHGTWVGAGTLIGMSATILGGTRIGRRCLVAAGAVVPPNLLVPDEMVVMGVPGKIVRSVRPEELKYMAWLTTHYMEMAEQHVQGKFPSLLP